MEIMALHEAALDRAAELVAGLALDQVDQPTSCTDRDVDVSAASRWQPAVGREAWAGPRAGRCGRRHPRRPGCGYRASGEALEQAWPDEGRLDRTYRLPFGELPGRVAITMHLLEEVTHGWVLATATGQDRGFDPEAVQVVSEFVCGSMSGERPPGMPFRAAPGDAMPLDQLAAFFGRRR